MTKLTPIFERESKSIPVFLNQNNQLTDQSNPLRNPNQYDKLSCNLNNRLKKQFLNLKVIIV